MQGKGICSGIAVGKICYIPERVSEKQHVSDDGINRNVIAETAGFYAAKQRALQCLNVLQEKANREAGEREAEIFRAYQQLLQDTSINAYISNQIRSHGCAVREAICRAQEFYTKAFESMTIEQTRAKAADIRAVCQLLLQMQTKSMSDQPKICGNGAFILAKKYVTPWELMQYDREKLKGIITERESRYSHTAILARSFGIPLISGVKVSEAWQKRWARIDGETGTVVFDVEETAEKTSEGNVLLSEQKLRSTVDAVRGMKQKIAVYASVSQESEISQQLQMSSDGIGLFRSEYLYMEYTEYPSEEILVRRYSNLSAAMKGKPVIIRLPDIGADKGTSYMALPMEKNPQLGSRGMRFLLLHEEVLKTQLRALLRIRARYPVSILLPMVTAQWEVQRVKKMLQEQALQLQQEGFSIRIPELGVMIETPAAALISDLLSEEAAFLSIGMNDLLQYTMAADRQNDSLEQYLDPSHPAIGRLIHMIIENGHRHNRTVMLCGAFGNNLGWLQELAEQGLDACCIEAGEVKRPLPEVISDGF